MGKKHQPEEIIGKLREAEIVLVQGSAVADACRRIGVTEQSYYRWRKEYGGVTVDQAHRMKDLEWQQGRSRQGNRAGRPTQPCVRYVWFHSNHTRSSEPFYSVARA
jgi:hypothetical protein